MKCLFSSRLAVPPVVQSEEAEAQVFVLVIPEPKIQKYCPFLSFIILNKKKHKVSEEKYKTLQLRGRIEKPLLSARPVRDIPKSTPRLNPPLQLGSLFRRRALGGSCCREIALSVGV